MSTSDRRVVIGPEPIDYQRVVAVADGDRAVVLSDAPEFRRQVDHSRRALESMVADGATIYGVTTGFGENCVTDVDSDNAHQLAQNLYRFHGCGTGDLLTPRQSAAVLVVRLQSLCHGRSAVSWAVLEGLAELINRRILPAIPERGSVGASGDLTPLSYVAAVLNGKRQVWVDGQLRQTAEVFEQVGIEPVALGPKESLALMNGTSVMTALAALALDRAESLVRISACVSACVSDVCQGNAAHFDARIFSAKPHPGQARVAAIIRDRLDYDPADHVNPERIQDRYCIRCSPHVIGVLADAIDAFEAWVDTELNSANDNPLFDADTRTVLHGGNFYGGHIAFAMDALKSAVASVADLLDRQLQLLCQPQITGLPANLVAGQADRHGTRHGFKAMSISTSALAAEALKLTMPAASFSRSTESHNQDKVSMGTIASRDMLAVVELAEEVAAILLIAGAQGAEVRGLDACRPATAQLHRQIRQDVALTTDDRRHDRDIEGLVERIRADLADQLCPQRA